MKSTYLLTNLLKNIDFEFLTLKKYNPYQSISN